MHTLMARVDWESPNLGRHSPHHTIWRFNLPRSPQRLSINFLPHRQLIGQRAAVFPAVPENQTPRLPGPQLEPTF